MWTNRNDSGNGFNAAFGGQAALARQVVDAALNAWERVITDFNWPDNPDDNTFEVEITVDTGSTGCGGAADTGADDDGVPQDGDFELGAGGTCGPNNNLAWWLDPTPNDSAEFRGEIANAFALNATPLGLAAGRHDLFTVVVVEMAHLLGISGDEDFLFEDLNDNTPPFTDTGQDDAAYDVGTLWVYDFGGVQVLFTDNNGGNGGDDTDEPLHVAEPVLANLVNQGGKTFYGAQDVGNATYERGRRYLPSRLLARVMDEIYPYDIVMPERFGTAYANFDSVTGDLLLRGGSNGEGIYFSTSPSNDTFTLTRDGNNLRVEVEIGSPVPGTGADTTLTSFFNFADIQSISIQTSSDPNVVIDSTGDDTFIFDFSAGPIIPAGGITVDGGTGSNALFVLGSSVPQTYLLDSSTITVGSGLINYDNIEVMRIVAEAATTNNSIRVDSTPSDLLDLVITGSNGDDIILIEGHHAATVTQINTRDGFDQVYFSFVSSNLDDVEGFIVVEGGGDGNDDELRVFDSQDVTDNVYLLGTGVFGTGTVERNTSLVIQYNNLEFVEVRGGRGDDLFDARNTTTGTPVDLHGGFGDDDLIADSNGSGPGGVVDGIDSLLTFDGGVGHDTALLNDIGDSTADQVTVTDTQVGNDTGDTFFGVDGAFRYEDIEQLNIDMGRPGDVIRVKSTDPGTPVFIDGGLGNDQFFVNSFDAPDKRTGNTDGIRSHLLLLGSQGDDLLLVDDSAGTDDDLVTITDTEVGHAPGDNYFGPGGHVTYDSMVTLAVLSGEGTDAMNLQSTHPLTATQLRGGAGDDLLLVDSNGGDLLGTVDLIRSAVILNGEAGDDHIVLQDSSDAAADVITVTHIQVGSAPGDTYFGAGGSLSYIAERIEIFGTSDDDTVTVTATAAGTRTEVLSGEGNDVILVDSNAGGAAGDLNGVKSTLVLLGGPGNDQVLLEDSSDPLVNTAGVTLDTVGAVPGDNFFGPGGSLEYGELEFLVLRAGTAGDNFFVISTGAPTVILAGDGNDVVIVDSNGAGGGGVADLITHPLGVGGGAGLNILRVGDEGDASDNLLTMTDTALGDTPDDTFFGPGGRIAYTDLSNIDITFGSGDDALYLQSTAPATANVTVLGGPGDNRFLLDSNGEQPGGTVDLIRSQVLVAGNPGSQSRVEMNDADDTTGDRVSIQTDGPKMGRVGHIPLDTYFGVGGRLQYAQISEVVVRTGDTAGDLILAEMSNTLTGAVIRVDGNDPETAPGDTLMINLAGVGNPVQIVSGPSSGLFTSSNHTSFYYQEIETVNVAGAMPPMVPLGDTDADGDVDIDDLNNVRNNFGSGGPAALGDTDGDGDVDIDDLNNVRNNFGANNNAPLQTTQTLDPPPTRTRPLATIASTDLNPGVFRRVTRSSRGHIRPPTSADAVQDVAIAELLSDET